MTPRPSDGRATRGHHGPASRAFRTTLVGVAAVALVACGSDSSAATRLPDVEVQDLVGGGTVLASELGGPAVVNLWATWCAPCRAEMPAFEAVHADIGDEVRFVGINEGDEGPAAAAFVAEVGVTFDQYLDLDGGLTDGLRIAGLPATVVLDEDGSVLTVHNGALTEDGLRSLIDEHLGG